MLRALLVQREPLALRALLVLRAPLVPQVLWALQGLGYPNTGTFMVYTNKIFDFEWIHDFTTARIFHAA